MPWPFGGGRWFPGTNLQDLNLDWIIRRVRDLSKGIIAPWINPENQHWMVYDVELEVFVDSGVSAVGEGEGPPGKGIPAGGRNGDALIKDGATDYVGKWTSSPPQMGSLAYIEQTSTVSKQDGYQPGEYLVYNGQLYKVGNDAISQGQTLTPGVNISAVSVMAEMRRHLTFVSATATVVSDMTSSAMALYTITLNIDGYDRTRIRQFIYMGMTNPAGIIPTTHNSSGAENVTCYGFATNAQSQTAGNTFNVRFLYET